MHYDRLIERARGRTIDGYIEQHHVLPRCLGGDDSAENLVRLTPEEHFVAHQLLVKIYPKEQKLIYAALMMTVSSKTHIRNNKLYGWLRRKYQKLARQRTGKKSSSYGKPWYHNPKTVESGKFLPGEEPQGWIKGRVPKIETRCVVCQNHTGSYMARFCKTHRLENKNLYAAKVGRSYRKRKDSEDREKFTHAITTSTTWKEAIYKAGYKTDGYSRTRLQRFAKENNLSLLAD